MTRTSLAVLAAFFCLSISLAPADARAAGSLPTAWVSATRGADGAGCGATTSPCRTFQYVLENVVATGGSVLILDPGDYGPMVITFPVSIINDGPGNAVLAGFLKGATVVVSAPGLVTLRGLIIDGARGGSSGVVMTPAGGSLAIEKCKIVHFTANGSSSAGVLIMGNSPYVTISDSSFSGNSGDGVQVDSSGGNISIRRSTAFSNGRHGFSYTGKPFTSAGRSMTIEDSIAWNNSGAGVYASGGLFTKVTMVRTNATNNYLVDLQNVDATMRTDGTAFSLTSSGNIYIGPLN